MNELVYVGSALTASMIGSAILYLRARRPQRVEAGVDEFARALHVLSARHSKGGRAG